MGFVHFLFSLVVMSCLLLLCALASASASSDETDGAFIQVLSNQTLVIQPPQGGSVSIVNFTELSSTRSELSSANAELSSTKTQLALTSSSISSTQSEISSMASSTSAMLASTAAAQSEALVRLDITVALLSSALRRISALEVLGGTVEQTSPVSYIVALGGRDPFNSRLDSVEMFNATAQAWRALPSMIIARAEYLAACPVNGSVIVACGGLSSGFNSWLNSCEILDLKKQDGWKMIASMKAIRGYASGTILPDKKSFLMIGGYDGNVIISSCEKLDILSNAWSYVANLSDVRDLHSSVLYNNTVVAISGRATESIVHKSCEQYDPTTNTWSAFPSVLTGRHSFGAAVVLGKIYIAGGIVEAGFSVASVEVFDGVSWMLLASSPMTRDRWQHTAVVFQNKLVVLGGSDVTTIEVFDPASNSWNASFPAMTVPAGRIRLTAVSF